MTERQQRLRLGIFVVLTLGLFGGLILLFGGAPTLFSKSVQYTMIFSDAPGIAAGTPIRKSGVKVGVVSAVVLDDTTGQVRVSVALNPNFTPRTSDEPTVTRGILAGDTAIDFIPRSTEKAAVGDPIPPGTVIQGVSPFNAKILLDQATGVVPEAQRSLEQLRKSLEALERVSPQIETTFREIGDLAKSGREFIPELKRTNDSFRDLFVGTDLNEIKGIIPELKKTNDEVRFFLKTASFWIEETGVMVKKNEPKIAKAIDSLTTTSDRVGEIFNAENQKNIAEVIKNSRDASARFDRLAMGAEDLMKDGKVAMKTFNSAMGQTEQAITEV
ncbi:MAG: MlaD family protein, partial [Planctomycetes bacterium]|nr:MlaD family protein [Planctomycetota bacterium]